MFLAATPRTRDVVPANPPDQGGIVLGWLFRLSIVLSLVGVLAYDGLSVVASRFTVEDQATTAALTASDMWKRTHDIERTYQAALLTAQAADAHNNVDRESFVVIGDGTVTLTMERKARTVVAGRLPALRDLFVVSGTAQNRSAT
ncbi:MAG: hypothetical protein GXX79_10810 [Actinomycetales bacterium]|nr:hypothetical protein [Actinomycetales bacterium]